MVAHERNSQLPRAEVRVHNVRYFTQAVDSGRNGVWMRSILEEERLCISYESISIHPYESMTFKIALITGGGELTHKETVLQH